MLRPSWLCVGSVVSATLDYLVNFLILFQLRLFGVRDLTRESKVTKRCRTLSGAIGK